MLGCALDFLWGLHCTVGGVVCSVISLCILSQLFIYYVWPQKSLEKRTILVTGGGSGLGRHLVLEFLRVGAGKVIIWDVNKEGVQETIQEVKRVLGEERASRIEMDQVNVADYKDVQRAAAKTSDVYMLVNNAGIVTGRSFMDVPIERSELSIKVNTVAHLYTVKEFLPQMLKRPDGGHLVTIASAAGFIPAPQMVDYCTSKFGAVGFLSALRMELVQQGQGKVKTTLVCPAHIHTPLFRYNSDQHTLTLCSGYQSSPLTPSLEAGYVAGEVVRAVRQDRGFLALPAATYAARFLSTFLPPAVQEATGKVRPLTSLHECGTGLGGVQGDGQTRDRAVGPGVLANGKTRLTNKE